MLYLKATKNHEILKWPLSAHELRKELHGLNVSAPENLEEVDLTHLGFYPVAQSKPPKPSLPHMRIGLGEPHWDGTKFVRQFIEETTIKTWADARRLRNKLLQDSDWTQLPDAALTKPQVKKWTNYRQALRDISKVDDITQIQWPQKPE